MATTSPRNRLSRRAARSRAHHTAGTGPEHDVESEFATEAQDAEISVDTALLRDVLAGAYAEERRASRELIKDERFHHVPGRTKEEQRDRTFEALKSLAGSDAVMAGLPTDQGGGGRPGAYVASFEEFVLADASLQIKAGVQWGLFGSAVLNLGTQAHHDKWLPDIWDLKIPGAFAMTETGHGSDVASIATTATYDPESQEFEIHTPHRAAWKDYLGNAAIHGRAAVVFAQLITGGVNHGVHALYVPIRNDDGQFLPGVGGEDDGHKGGLNGVDNGRLHFTHVRVPRENLLDRYGHVDPDGTYTSPIESPGRRFFTMLGTLVQGRVSLDGSSVVATRAGLAIALTYANERRQFSPVQGQPERTLLDYHRHRRRLFPYVARVLAAGFAHEELLEAYDDVFSGRTDTDDARQDLETLAAAMKATSTRLALDALQECREACGGSGFLSENRIVDLHHDMDVYATFEGDNTVLMQLVAKRLLGDHAREFARMDVGVMARWVADRATETAVNRSGLRGLSQVFRDSADPRRSVNALRDPETQRSLLTDRVRSMIGEVAENMRGAGKGSPEATAEAFDRNQHRLIEAARAHAHLLQWEAFTRALDTVEDPGTHQVLLWLRDLYGLSVIEEHLDWYLSHGRMSLMRGRMVESYVDRLVTRLRPHIMDVVDSFDLAPEHLRARIASGAEAQRQQEAADWVAAEKAAGRWPRSEKGGTNR
ncbi:acyl-CoA dehydrogenase [Kocuria sp. JC486]|uniref:acyl-CoA oxidase n=1 Tax=Kocuria soli TaxID=2485125 RepID=A0A3N3ZQB0_9MICC|nr:MULTISPECIES: acyl-CoA dehydrogenase [Kocuria]NHU84948.1 acyl-CoA dehydrogenase [Kocuria sp. JC486]ROZ63330.1 acyl-CoA dehydrogenase [Kocuria soli]